MEGADNEQASKTMPRNLIPETIKKFRGINVWSSYANSTPDQATDCLNVIVSGSGAIEKMRVPVALTPVAIAETLVRLREYENGNIGLRQVVGQFGRKLYTFDGNWTSTLIDTNPLNGQGLYDFIESNNRFFGANGFRNFKWDGTNLTNWGIVGPSAAPTVGTSTAPGAVPVNIGPAATPYTLGTAPGSNWRTSNLAVISLPSPGTWAGVNAGDILLVAGMSDASFNGVWTVNSVTLPQILNYFNVGPDTLNVAGGTATDFYQGGIYRYNNEVTVTTTTPHGRASQDHVTIAGVADTSFNGTFAIDSIVSPTQFTCQQVGPNATSGGGTETPSPSAIYQLGGRSYRVSYVNSKTGHISNGSPISAATGNLNGTLNVTLTAPASTDPQVDSAILWSTLDGGSDFYFNQQIQITPLTAPVFQDTTGDLNLDTSRIAPLINNPPPLGKYTAKYQGRSLVFDLPGDLQGLAYSGYEAILEGNPEESFPPNNLLHLQFGTSELRGVGACATGLVLFARSQRDKLDSMYLLLGQLQDITIDAPVQLSTFLRPLPWKLGCFSRYSVQETPHGVVWLASDKTIHLFDGSNQPVSLSDSINPLLRQITPGTESNIRSAFFNYIERDWYVLSAAINNAQSANQIVILDLNPDAAQNGGIFRSDIQADEIAVIEDGANQEMLVTVSKGLINQFLATSDTTSGTSETPTYTSGTLNAYWRSGVFGNTNPEMVKLFRWARIVRDPLQRVFSAQYRIIDETDNLQFPELGPIQQVAGDGRFPVNQKGRRMVMEVQFPSADGSANLVELAQNYIPLAER
jgi:hypothetical protein